MTKPFNLDAFIAFCREKGTQFYEPGDYDTCALAQFGFPGLTSADTVSAGVPLNVYIEAVSGDGREKTFVELAGKLESIR